MVLDRLGPVQERIANAAKRAGRHPQDVTLIAVTKTIPFERVLPFLHSGLRHIGENRVQEALAKYQNPDGTRRVEGTFHLIGSLQTNKVKKAVTLFDTVQTVDRLSLADELNRQGEILGRQIPCLIEVKISPEDTKAGVNPDELDDFLGAVRERQALSVDGLMGIAPYTDTAEGARPYFSKLYRLFEKTKLNVLSMGMSNDFEVAIEEGSTMIRLGRVLFGERS